MDRSTLARLSVVAFLFTSGCTTGNPLVPTPPTTTSTTPGIAAGTTTLKVSAPVALSPINDEKAARSPVTLTASAATGLFTEPTSSVFYRFEVFNPAGARIADSGPVAVPSWSLTAAMEDSVRHTWRVRAESGPFAGPWSTTASFLAPNPRPCGPPSFFDPFSIIACHRSLYEDHMTPSELAQMMLDVAIDFNRAGVPGGPYGRLVKTDGNNCDGYSCDIICAGQGGGQRQYDILIDERHPYWGSPLGGPVVRECRIP